MEVAEGRPRQRHRNADNEPIGHFAILQSADDCGESSFPHDFSGDVLTVPNHTVIAVHILLASSCYSQRQRQYRSRASVATGIRTIAPAFSS
jgi:hypothetical protein